MSIRNVIHSQGKNLDNILGPSPGWLISAGISIIFFIILGLLIGSYFFRYPETITTSAVLTNETPATWIVANTSGKIDSIYTRENTFVNEGQIIALLESTGNINHIYKLKDDLENIRENIVSGKDIHLISITKGLRVGELNELYTNLLKIIDEYILFNNEGIYKKKIIHYHQETSLKERLKNNIELQIENLRQYSSIEKKQFQRDSLLERKKITPSMIVENAEKQIINNNIKLYDLDNLLLNTQLDINRVNQNILDLELINNEKTTNFINNLLISQELLYNAILKWEKTYILKAPTDGLIGFFNYWSKNQNISAGEKAFYIVPNVRGKIIGKCMVKSSGLGNVNVGNSVIIKLNEYPYMRYGVLRAKVINISSMGVSDQNSQDRMAIAEVELEQDQTISTYGNELQMKGELTGIAEISTNDISLLENFIYPLKYLFGNFEKR